jgi:hypothetical protein
VTALRGPRGALIAVIALLLVTETALSPFYPRLFARLYGIDDPGATGLFLWSCRAGALLALPVLGLLARRVALPRLVAAGLAASTALDAALGLAPSFAAFTALSVAAAAAGSALLLAYPALVALEEGRGPGVGLFVGLFYAGTVAATLVGAGVLALPDPRVGISAFALVDLALLVLVLRALPAAGAGGASEPDRRPWAGSPQAAIVAVAAVAVIFELGANVVRPFFTAYAAQGGAGLGVAAVLFLLPALAALAAVPLAGRARAALGTALLPSAFMLAAAGLAVQAATHDPVTLAAGRVLLGIGLGLGHVELDRTMFAAVGTDGPGYAAVETVRGAGLLLAPVLAAATASAGLALPLATGAVLFALAATLAPVLSVRPSVEEAHVPSR